MASITDELREWASVEVPYKYGHQLNAIADRIDAEHEAKVSYWQGASYKDGYDEGFAGADDWLGQHEDAMAEHGWVKLPVDADGVPIHVGDEMECGDGTVFTVERISLYEFGWRCDGEGIDANGYKCTAHALPDCCHHHHASTVEDLLQKFGEKMAENKSMYISNVWDMDEWCAADRDTIAEYAKKLRLAGDAE